MRASHQNSPEHLAFFFRQYGFIHIHVGMPLLFSTYGGHCVHSLFVQHGCLLFFKFTLASGVLLMQEFSVSIIARFLQVGKTFAKKISRIYMYRNTVISHHRREKQDKWMVGEKRSKLEE